MKNLIKTKTAMSVYFLTGLIVIAALTFMAMTNSKLSASDDCPKINFEETVHDFGNVTQGTVLEHSFKFTNQGDKTLTIGSVNPACGCTGATLEGKNEYSKGEAGSIQMTFNTQGREGHIEKTISVSTNDSSNSVVSLRFKCDIQK